MQLSIILTIFFIALTTAYPTRRQSHQRFHRHRTVMHLANRAENVEAPVVQVREEPTLQSRQSVPTEAATRQPASGTRRRRGRRSMN
jgi:hypothetical protein